MPTCVQRWIERLVSEARRTDIGPMETATGLKGPNSRLASQLCGGLFWPKGNNRPEAVNMANSAQWLLPESNGRPCLDEPATRATSRSAGKLRRVEPPFQLEWLHNQKYGVT